MTTGERIKAARKKKGMTQAELANKLGISFVGVSQWENDIRNPKYETLEKIAKELDVGVWELKGVTVTSIGDVIAELRDERDISATQLSAMTDIPLQRVQEFEFSSAVPTIEELSKLAAALRVPVSAFYDKSPHLSKFDTQLISEAIDVAFRAVYRKQGDIALEDDPAYQILVRIDNALSELNPKGQQVAVERVEELTKIPDYRKAEDK